MSTLRDLKQRRFVQILVSYLAAGWIAIEVVDQLVDNELLPGLAYRLVLIWYLAGIPIAAVVAWFHGEQGKQKAPKVEVALIALFVLGLGGFTVDRVHDHVEERRALAAAAASGLAPDRIAVLYFEDLSAGQDLGHIADAFTEDLIDVLSRVRGLDVVPANGVLPFRQEDVDVAAVADSLEAGTIVAGAVDRTRDGVGVTVRLVDGASGVEFRRTRFEQPAQELMGAGDQVAAETARFLRERLGEEVRLRAIDHQARNVEAWSLVQQGRRAWKQAEAIVQESGYDGAEPAFAEADSLMIEAMRQDPTWALPLTLRSRVAFRRSQLAHAPEARQRFAAQAVANAESALERAPGDPEALEARGTARYWRYLTDPELHGPQRRDLLVAAREDLESAVDRDPTLASAYNILSHLYYNDEDTGLARVIMTAQRAYEEDAYLESASNILWRIHSAAADLGQFQTAVDACQEGRRRFPGQARFHLCRLRLMVTPALQPDVDHAWSLVAAVDSLSLEDRRAYHVTEARMFAAGVLHQAGLPDSAQAVLARAHEAATPQIDPHRELLSIEAIIRSRMGEHDRAVALVQDYLLANPGHTFDRSAGLAWWWRELETVPEFRRLIALRSEQS